jgi:asparagine synthase (glutamine-hydrolysing)
LYYVSKLASEHVKVVLSGEGGDEAFGGYPNYRNLLLFERGKSASRPFQSLVQHAIGGLAKLNKLERAQKYVPLVKMPLQKYYYTKTSSPFSYFNRNKSSIYTNQFRASLNGDGGSAVTDELFAHVKGAHLLNQMLYVDTKTWLPDDLLIKADKITMANSLELRVPMLDHKVLEFAASLPTAYKVKGITTKRILKKAMSARVPEEIIKRKKTGFPVPYEKWLQGELGPYVRDVLLDDAAVNRGYFKKKGIESLLKENATQPSLAREVFSLLVLELWHGQFA